MKSLIQLQTELKELVSRRERVEKQKMFDELTNRITELEIEILEAKEKEQLAWLERVEEIKS